HSNFKNLTVGQRLTYTISNNNIQFNSDTSEATYFNFIKLFHLFIIAASKSDSVKLSPRYIYFSPNRVDNNFNLQINLSSENYYELLANYSSVTSKQSASLIKLASLYFANKRRKFEHSATSLGYEEQWNNDEEVKLVSKYLNKLGYNWDLELQDANKNLYQIILIKDGKTFDFSQASSGEKEIINFLIGIFAFNIKDGLIIVDEPEVHLHPRWQILLIDLFFDLSKLTGNQFIVSTHSSVFINQHTLSSITRVYRNSNVSQVAVINQANIPTNKDLLHIINSHNNEKIFFADKVVLVEGITDRVFFEALINLYHKLFSNTTEVIEVLDVHGKINLAKYRKFLDTLSIPNFIIADLDYIEQIGNEYIKNLFTIDYKSINDNVIKRKKSQDGEALSKKLEDAIKTKDLEELTELFNYIKSRNKKLKENLNTQEKAALERFIQDKAVEKVFLLKSGEIENYSPDASKGLEALIEAVRQQKYLDAYLSESFSSQREEISRIIFSIFNLEQKDDKKVVNELKKHQNHNTTY
ncbi:ATP-dependent endonuclease, partial [uncultured Nostoc sp.]|uniref:ATP-dependent nuclease n=1 Tax=uncultured Nostoc sp. TaxID=340711 RepID=UPI0035CA907F